MVLAARTIEMNPLAEKELPKGRFATIGPPKGVTALVNKKSTDGQLGPNKETTKMGGVRVTKLNSVSSPL